MKEKRNLHKKMQELCDCYATTDPLAEMASVPNEEDKEEAALKWLALAALHGVNDNAEKISITQTQDGNIEVKAMYKKTNLPNPGPAAGSRILQTIRDIIHLEEDKGSLPLSLGIRDSSVDLQIKIKKKEDKEKVTLKFPQTE